MKSSIYKCISVILISFTIIFQYACNEPQSVEQQTKTKSSSRLSTKSLSGAIFTTDDSHSKVNLNIFSLKEDVYLWGENGLTPGDYYCQVTDPSGKTVLGTSIGSSVPMPIQVTINGEFADVYQLVDIVWSEGAKGFDNSNNSGGEYKVYISQDPTFDESQSKTDNFKVTGGTPPPRAHLQVIKFYDSNANGSKDDGEALLEGWMIKIIDDFEYIKFTPVDLIVEPGEYTVSEFFPKETNWMPTTLTSVPLSVTVGTEPVKFGNVCLGAGGGLTLGFWSNKNGMLLVGTDDLAMLNKLNLCDPSGLKITLTSGNFRAWLLGATATNMAYMLSVQLAAMELNVFNGKVTGNPLVYAPGAHDANGAGFMTVSALMDEANAALGSSTDRSYLEALKNALDYANNNKTFVQVYNPLTCPYTFL